MRVGPTIERLRLRLAAVDTVPQLAALGIVCGLLSAAVIIAFRITIEGAQIALLPGNEAGGYEALPLALRLALPVAGGAFIGLVLQFVARRSAELGVVHVMERLAYHQGRLPFRNAAAQFLGAAASIAAGHSVGREGPSVHLGAASGSLLGQHLGLPFNSIRTLVGCGVAAAIAAGFNTPIAGVIFAMEVVMMEYTIAGFAPVILSAVGATALTRLVFGSAPAFSVPALQLGSILELPIVLAMGLAIGAMAALYITLQRMFIVHGAVLPLWVRTTLAGAVTGLCAMAYPQVMGIGYDTVGAALAGQIGLSLLVGIAAFKLLATAAAIGLGLPGGLIGPTLVIGATAGGAMGLIAHQVLPGDVASHGFYAMIGMGAMMGATLQAPLSALMAMLELTANPNIIFPGMLAVISAGIVSRYGFGCDSVYLMQMKARGLDYRNDPVAQTLRAVSVGRAMNHNFVTTAPRVGHADAGALLRNEPLWIVVQNADGPDVLMPGADLARHLGEENAAAADGSPADIDLMAIPASRLQIAGISLRSTLQDALEELTESRADALAVFHGASPRSRRIVGIVTRKAIEGYYLYGR